jgi:hypothetical protein
LERAIPPVTCDERRPLEAAAVRLSPEGSCNPERRDES